MRRRDGAFPDGLRPLAHGRGEIHILLAGFLVALLEFFLQLQYVVVGDLAVVDGIVCLRVQPVRRDLGR